MWLIAAFAATGFLVGNLMALSATSTVSAVLGLLFALFGGSLIAFLDKLSVEDRAIAGKLSFALCICCLVGVYSGIFVRERQLLTPRDRRFQELPSTRPADSVKGGAAGATAADTTSSNKASDSQKGWYLAGQLATDAQYIDYQVRHGDITADVAYSKLLAKVKEQEAQLNNGK